MVFMLVELYMYQFDFWVRFYDKYFDKGILQGRQMRYYGPPEMVLQLCPFSSFNVQVLLIPLRG